MSATDRLESQPSYRIGVIDTGVNPWHSHVSGGVTGLRIYVDAEGKICEDDDFRDRVGHGTAVAGILRQRLPEVELFVVRVFDEELNAYPSLVARAILRAAAAGCIIINLSLGMSPGPGAEILAVACREVLDAGVVLVASGHPDKPDLLPASLSGVVGVVAADHLKPGDVEVAQRGDYQYAASGQPRDLEALSGQNMWGNSFACARISLHFALQSTTDSVEV
jgi:subtilisin family serine protease